MGQPEDVKQAENRQDAHLARLARLSREATQNSGGGGSGALNLLDSFVAEAVRATGATRGFVALADYDAGGLVLVASSGEGWTEEARRQRLRDRDGTNTVTSRVATHCRPVRLADIEAEAPDYHPFFPDVRSVLAMPVALSAEGRVRGVLNLESRETAAFGPEDEAFAAAVADLAALRLGMEDLRAREVALVQMGRELAAAPSLDALMQRVVVIAREILRFEDCSVFFLDPASQRYVLAATRGALASQVNKASYAPGEGLTGWVAENGKPVRVRSLRDDPRWKGLYLEMEEREIGAFLAVPIKAQAGVVGVLRVLRRASTSPWFPNDFTAADQEVLETIAQLVGAAADNSRLTARLLQSERMAAWGEMSAMSSHMIGNRVFAIKGELNELEYVLGEGRPEDTLAHLTRAQLSPLIDGMKRGLYGLEELLAEFRDFVRATALSPTPLDLTELVRTVVAETFPRRGKVVLTETYAEEPLPLLADPVKLKRALSEIVENAVSFQETSGGALRVATRRLLPGVGPIPPALAATLSRASEGRGVSGWATVTFEDDGPGVPDKEKERIFHPFVTSRARGMGLGLAIVKGIIEAHHGAIAEIGRPGEGAHFVVALPLRED